MDSKAVPKSLTMTASYTDISVYVNGSYMYSMRTRIEANIYTSMHVHMCAQLSTWMDTRHGPFLAGDIGRLGEAKRGRGTHERQVE
jgi:hypothetical protein